MRKGLSTGFWPIMADAEVLSANRRFPADREIICLNFIVQRHYIQHIFEMTVIKSKRERDRVL
jgi:hypothetical protein